MSIADVQQTAANPSSAQLEPTPRPRPDLNGMVLQRIGGHECSMVDNGLNRYIPNWSLFRDGRATTPFDTSIISNGSSLRPDALLIADGTGPIYLLDVDPAEGSSTLVKRWIVDAKTFDQYQFAWDKVQRLPAIVVAAIPRGKDIVGRP
jgi:hypothetical protein